MLKEAWSSALFLDAMLKTKNGFLEYQMMKRKVPDEKFGFSSSIWTVTKSRRRAEFAQNILMSQIFCQID